MRSDSFWPVIPANRFALIPPLRSRKNAAPVGMTKKAFATGSVRHECRNSTSRLSAGVAPGRKPVLPAYTSLNSRLDVRTSSVACAAVIGVRSLVPKEKNVA